MYKYLILIMFTFSIFAQKKHSSVTFEFEKDTLKSKLRLCDSIQNASYYKLLDAKVDTKFVILDSIKTRINKDSKFDYVFVLTNKIQEEDSAYTDCNTKYAKRLLIVFLSNGNNYYSHIINEDVVLNNIEYQSNPFRKITSLKEGFKLSFYFGTRIRYYYDFYFKADKENNIFLEKSKSNSYDIHISGTNKSRKNGYTKSKSTNLKNINIRNFIKYY